ncbi:hypothetical protein NHQ30_007044 [Ciborinia camelliae]|nr:hypothetical protein NHQ30_007044 [Ciborinia camelliae]
MPRPTHPPTPASSTEIKGKDGSSYSSLQMSFELPPPAVAGMDSRPTSSSTKASSASSYQPISPTSPAIPASEAVKLRRRSATQNTTKDSFALPPPPTRSRKIIQMKPRGLKADETMNTPAENTKSGGKPTANSPKKKQPSSTSVAGRKIARKTAHSLIERRRRSKMNEEFGVLKDMIPACTGEMHKLAILQASIDYVRYLEDCVAKLKAENSRGNFPTATGEFTLPPSAHRGSYAISRQHSTRGSEEDIEMTCSENSSSNYATPVPPSQQNSPAMFPQDSRHRQDSYSSVSTNHRHYSISTSSTTSPALGPSAYEYARSIASVGSAFTSPALMPQRDVDEEASAALLMLNSDRRGTNNSGVRGMSVRDLLSS